MADEDKGDSTSHNATERYDMSGKKWAYIFSWGTDNVNRIDPNQKDVSIIAEALKNLGFEFDKELYENEYSDDDDDDDDDNDDNNYHYSHHCCDEDDYYIHYSEECYDPDTKRYYTKKKKKARAFEAIRDIRPINFINLMSMIAPRVQDASCILMYFITRQNRTSLIEEYSKHIPVFHAWKKFKKINCAKVFLVQANVEKHCFMDSALLNAEVEKKDPSIPASANVMLAYLPNFDDAALSVAEVVKEELCKPYDMNAIMTTVINRINVKGRCPNPKFSSTLLKTLYLRDGPDSQTGDQLPIYSISEGKKCLAYAFLFGEFEVASSLMELVHLNTEQLTSAFNSLGFDFSICTKDGKMTVDEFNEKLTEIVNDKKKMEMCECIMIVISTHGEEDGFLYATNGLISRDLVLHALANCRELDGKPKLLLLDACRGSSFDKPVEYRTSGPSTSTASQDSNTMCTITRYHSIYQRDAWKLGYYEKPEMSDVMIVTSSAEGMVSVFRSRHGSHFLKNLSESLMKYGKEYDLMTILNATMSTVAHLDIMFGNLKQQITFTSSLRKLLHFPT